MLWLVKRRGRRKSRQAQQVVPAADGKGRCRVSLERKKEVLPDWVRNQHSAEHLRSELHRVIHCQRKMRRRVMRACMHQPDLCNNSSVHKRLSVVSRGNELMLAIMTCEW